MTAIDLFYIYIIPAVLAVVLLANKKWRQLRDISSAYSRPDINNPEHIEVLAQEFVRKQKENAVDHDVRRETLAEMLYAERIITEARRRSRKWSLKCSELRDTAGDARRMHDDLTHWRSKAQVLEQKLQRREND